MSVKTSSARGQRAGQRCSICLSHIRQRGSLDSCQHPFCFPCIQQWAKIENTCPICKRRFQEIRQPTTPHRERSKNKPRKCKVAKVDNKNQEDRQYQMFLEGIQQGFIEDYSQELLFLNQLIFEGIPEIDFSQEFDGQDTPVHPSLS